MKIITRLLIISFTLIISACSTVGTKPSEDVWIDVRSVQEYEEEHLDDTYNIPHTDISSRISGITMDKEAKICVYCRSGRRADIAQKTLEAMGYTNVNNIGGIEDARELRNNL